MNANTYDSPSTAGGNREDLRGPLRYLEPEATPFTSMVKTGPSPKSTLVEHGADTLDKPKVTGSREGDSGAKGGNKASNVARFGSYLHRWMRTFGTTDVQQLITEAGGNAFIPNQYDWSKAKAVRELKRDIEATLLCHNDGQGGSDDTMKSRGAFKWHDATMTPQVPTNFVTPAAQRLTGVTDLLETGTNSLNGVLKAMFESYGQKGEYQCFIGSDYQEDADMFTRTQGETTAMRYNVNENAEAGTISLFVKVFNSSFGRVNFIPSTFLRWNSTTQVNDTDALLICNMDLWELLWLENPHSMDDDEDAGGANGYCKAIGGLFNNDPRGGAYIYNA
jgi:hypothetical protein